MEKTIYDVAKLAGVSTATVSRVINNIGNVSPKSEAKVRLAMEKLQYSPNALARGFAQSKSKTIGLVMDLPNIEDKNIIQISSFFFTELFRGVNSILRQKGYFLMVINEEHNLEGLVRNFLDQKRIDGLIVGYMPADTEDLEKVLEVERPLVYIGNIHEYNRGLHVYAQYIEYLNDVLVYFKSKGHRSIAFLSQQNDKHLQKVWDAENKDGSKNLTIYYLDYKNYDSFIDEVKEVFSKPDRPTAFFVENIGMIQQITTVLHELGLSVPDDVSLMSVEHVKGMGENFSPKITCMYVPVTKMGEAAIRLLLEYIEGKSDSFNKKVNIQPALIERDSVADKR
ncbi:MAG: LacI family DNA-binding transcriptional regulator [Spirochaetales bacterium]|nr:LacI family DNA-binding transcriptional regulator [Spirochaetales bacterium]